MTKAELIKKLEENRDAAEKASNGVSGILSAAYQEEADIWVAAINLACQLEELKPVEAPIPPPRRRIELFRKDGLWQAEIWEESSPGAWVRVWEDDRGGWASMVNAAICARDRLYEMP